MRHEHLVVTVESGIKTRIEDDLDSGETVEAWIGDAIEEKLADDGATDPGTDAHRTNPETGDDRTNPQMDADWTDSEMDAGRPETDADQTKTDTGRVEESDDYDEGFEYVDDCSI